MAFTASHLADNSGREKNWKPPEFKGEAWPFIGGDLQTIRHVILRPPSLLPGFVPKKLPDMPAGRQQIQIRCPTPDGDQLLGWLHLPSQPARAVVICLHGLTGSADSWHCRLLASCLLERGLAVLRANMRGAGESRAVCRTSYSAKSGADIGLFAEQMAARFDQLPVFVVGVSLGGTAALNMTLDDPSLSGRLAGLVTISSPLDMLAASDSFHRPRNWLYMRYILSGLKRLALASPDQGALPARPHQIATVREFDERITAPMHGFSSALAYYQAASVRHRLAGLTCPTLILQADNDPWVPAGALLDARLSDTTSALVTRGGGHVGFADGGQLPWFVRCTDSWISHLLASR